MNVDPSSERGSVTAELALSLPAVVLALVLALAVGRVAIAQVQCVDAARAGARAAARGEAADTVIQQARRLAPSGAGVTATRNGGSVAVDVSGWIGLPLPGSPQLQVRGQAISQVEQP
jgi:hypothetical protein